MRACSLEYSKDVCADKLTYVAAQNVDNLVSMVKNDSTKQISLCFILWKDAQDE
jgi:hypothetical protein